MMPLMRGPERSRDPCQEGPSMPERDPDRLPTSTDPSGPCPRCGRLSNFGFRTSHPVTFDRSQPIVQGTSYPPVTEQMAVLECMGRSCGQCVVVIEQFVTPGSPSGGVQGIHWWPAPGAADLDPDIPEPVASAFSEGMRALSANCPRAAAVMFRGTLTEIVRDQGGQPAQQAPTLFQQLKAMEQEGTLHPSLVEWAAEIRLVANAAAHLDELEPVDQAEAAALGRLCRHLLTMVYETPASIRRARQPQPSP
jgi:Domain of unknown function (DUF4145)